MKINLKIGEGLREIDSGGGAEISRKITVRLRYQGYENACRRLGHNVCAHISRTDVGRVGYLDAEITHRVQSGWKTSRSMGYYTIIYDQQQCTEPRRGQ